MLGEPHTSSQTKLITGTRVQITSLPALGQLYQACFESEDLEYTSICSSKNAANVTPISLVGTAVTDHRGIVMFSPSQHLFGESLTHFGYRLVDADDPSLTTDEVFVYISVRPVNDGPRPLVPQELHVLESAHDELILNLRGVDDDLGQSRYHANGVIHAQVTVFPLGGLLYTYVNGNQSDLLDGTVGTNRVVGNTPKVPVVTEHADGIVRFSTQFSRCSGCFSWAGAGGTRCNQANSFARSTCSGQGCSAPSGQPHPRIISFSTLLHVV